MKTVLKYPGAKNRLANSIVEFIPNHEVYLEPYFGSGAIFFNKPLARIETINDLDDNVVNYFKVLRDHSEEFIRRIELTPWSREEYERAYQDTDDEIEQARRFAVRCWQGFGCANLYKNGFRSSQQRVSPVTTKSWKQVAETLKEATKRLQHAQIESLPAVELLKRYNTEDVFIYLDPPYVTSTRKNYLYKHEMTDFDHEELLNVIVNHPGKILLSGYENELYDKFLKGWNKSYLSAQAENGLSRVETLWFNYDIGQMDLFREVD